MTKLIKLSDLQGAKKELKPIEFVKCYTDGWVDYIKKPSDYETIIHLGNKEGWDYFIAYDDIRKVIHYRGHLNDGVIE